MNEISERGGGTLQKLQPLATHYVTGSTEGKKGNELVRLLLLAQKGGIAACFSGLTSRVPIGDTKD